MSGRRFDEMADVEGAWTRFRSRLADEIAALEDDDCLFLKLQVGIDDGDLPGAAPYLQFVGWGGDLVRGEVVSNAHLDERFRLSGGDEERLVEIGWSAPTYGIDDEPDSGSLNFHTDREVREADLLAVMSVRALREVFGCAHPVFLNADGLELDPVAEPPPVAPAGPTAGPTAAAPEPAGADEEVATFPESREQLQELVDRALAVMLEEPVRHDEDGDVPIVTGKSVLFVQVVDDRPAVDLYAEVVCRIGDLERAAQEVAILNRGATSAKFSLREDRVLLRYRLYAWPFAPAQLRVAVADLRQDLDDVARDLAARVRGLRFLEESPVAEPAPEPAPVPTAPLCDLHLDPDDAHPSMIGLLELLVDGPVAPGVVATMFDDDAELVTSQIARVRSGAQPTGEHHPDVVAALLRRALRLVVEEKAARDSFGRSRSSPRPATRQLALLPEPEGSPEAGLWSSDHLGETS
jgi:hypothetical protein